MEIDMDKLRMKFSASNADFNGPVSIFLGSKKPAHESIKERYPVSVTKRHQIWMASLSWKRLQVGMDMLPITTSTSDELFSRINIDDFERPWPSKRRSFY